MRPSSEVGVDLVLAAVVGAHLGAGALQDALGERAGQRADAPAAERRERARRRRVAAPDREPLGGDVVGPRERADALLLVGDLDAVQRDVEVAAPEQIEQQVPLALHRPRPHAELGRERGREIDLEADQVIRIHRILEDVRRAALRVGAPAQLAARADAREGVGGRLVGAARDRRGRERERRRARVSSERGASQRCRRALREVKPRASLDSVGSGDSPGLEVLTDQLRSVSTSSTSSAAPPCRADHHLEARPHESCEITVSTASRLERRTVGGSDGICRPSALSPSARRARRRTSRPCAACASWLRKSPRPNLRDVAPFPLIAELVHALDDSRGCRAAMSLTRCRLFWRTREPAKDEVLDARARGPSGMRSDRRSASTRSSGPGSSRNGRGRIRRRTRRAPAPSRAGRRRAGTALPCRVRGSPPSPAAASNPVQMFS